MEHSDIVVYPGIEARYNHFRRDSLESHHGDSPFVMEVNHCHYGRAGWHLNNDTSIYVGEGDLTVHSTALCSRSRVYFPLGHYEGITIVIDFSVLAEEMPEILRSVNLEKIRAAFCKQDSSCVFSADPGVEQIFGPLYHLPEEMVVPYLKLKVQELLLFLNLQTLDAPEPTAYNSETIETIRAIHALLTQDIRVRHTIEELSRDFCINTSTLKEVFKAVYGMPIASYMKDYRIRHAARLLRHTQDSVAQIAAQVGYETQSKFTQAFRETLGTTPLAYRKGKS